MLSRQVKNLNFTNFKVTEVQPRRYVFTCSMDNNEPVKVEKTILEKLSLALNPLHVEVINESYMHNVPRGSETHFKVVVVSQQFENVPLLARHRLVNTLLQHELENGVHALSIVAKTPDQWKPGEQIRPSPKCLGGFGK